jgi:hypothetical protein
VFSLIVLQIHFHVGSDSQAPTAIGIESAPNQWRRTAMNGDDGLGYIMQPVTVRITEQSEVGYPGLAKQ